MTKSITFIGQKKGMMQLFDAEGKLVVCTVIAAEPNTVVQVKRQEVDGYNALQLGGIAMTKAQAARVSKPLKGHFAKKELSPFRVLRESRMDSVEGYQVGQAIDVTLFSEGCYVDIESVSKGKGFQGVIKLHGMSGGPAAHGSGFHRHMGSTGMRSTPGRCFPNGKRASRMGGDRTTVQNLRVVAIQGKFLLVEGTVPGAREGVVYIRSAIKKQRAVRGKS